MLFDRIEDRAGHPCAIFRTDLETFTDEEGRQSIRTLGVDKQEQAYNEASLVQYIANTKKGGRSAEAASMGLAMLRSPVDAKPKTSKGT